MASRPLLILAFVLTFVAGWFSGRWAPSKHPRTVPSATQSAAPESRGPKSREPFPATSNPPQSTPQQATESAFKRISADEIQKRIARLPRPKQESEYRRAIAELVKADPAAAIRLAEAIGNRQQRESMLAYLFWSWAQVDPSGAKAYARSQPDSARRDNLLSSTAQALTEKDPQGALSLIQEISSAEKRNSAKLSWGVSWSQKDPVAAADWCLRDPSEFQRQHTLMHILSHWIQRDPSAAEAWASSHLEGPSSAEIAQRVLSGLLQEDFSKGRSFYQKLSPELRQKNAGSFAAAWVKEEPAAALQWAMQSPENSEKPGLLRWVIRSWSEEDPNAVADWVAKQPPSSQRDVWTQEFVNVAVNLDPESAFASANSIQDASMRESTLMNLARTWLSNDAPRARAWVQTSPLFTPEQRARLLQESR